MHVVECAFECGGLDERLKVGGISVHSWSLALEFARRGNRVSFLTPAHGALPYLRKDHEVERLDYVSSYELPLRLDPDVWPDSPGALTVALTTSAHRIRHGGLDIYLLSNDYLDRFPDKIYPSWTDEGRDLSYFKSLVFQIDCVEFIKRYWRDQELVVHAHEPFYHYLLALALREHPSQHLVSTINSNMPINKAVYRPQLEAVLDLLGLDAHLDELTDPAPATALDELMRGALRRTRLLDHGRPGYVPILPLVTSNSAAVDFLSEAHRDFYMTFRDTPLEPFRDTLPVARTVKASAHRYFVSGCGISAEWRDGVPEEVKREEVLTSLGLDPAFPTFYHAARYAPGQKGQIELMGAVDRVLATDRQVNFIIRCVTGNGTESGGEVGNASFLEIARGYPDNIRLEWTMAPPRVLFQHAAASDFCVYPSKYELDTFLLSQAEAMMCGAVPIGTLQQMTSHLGHMFDTDAPMATGFALRRSFRGEDPQLVSDLVDRLLDALSVLREQPEKYARLRRNAMTVARGFTWDRAARRHLHVYRAVVRGTFTNAVSDVDAIRYGWFDGISADGWRAHADEIARQAIALGDVDALRRCRKADRAALRQLVESAYDRADFVTCERLAAESGLVGLAASVAARCRVEQDGGRWRVSYTFPRVAQVLLFYHPSPAQPGVPMAERYLSREGGSFVGTFEGPVPVGPLCFLLSLDDGRLGWDAVVPGRN
ncbi:MAG TPA: glycogen/starch synthase [Rugosimonospora sp.]|nr:glycogen/starch synthase [Rugosimonospora sp.]